LLNEDWVLFRESKNFFQRKEVMEDEVIELMRNSKLRNLVIETMEKVCSYAGTLHDNPDEEMLKNVEEFGTDLMEEAWWRAEISGDFNRVREAFQNYVIDKLSIPCRITLAELVEPLAYMTHEMDLTLEELEARYDAFLSYVANAILLFRSSAPFPICIVRSKEENGDKVLWSKGEIAVSLHGTECIGDAFIGWMKLGKMWHLQASVEGRLSNLACERLRDEVSQLIPSVLASAHLLRRDTDASTVQEIIGNLPVVVNINKLLDDSKAFIDRCIDAYYSKPMKKDSMGKRIRNAVHLLVESDRQANDSVGLAISITAVEALLAEGRTEEISQRLSESVGILLEPDLSKRNEARKFVKHLYNLRSDALHGTTIEGEQNTRGYARHLAAGVLAAVITRQEFMRRAGYDPETPSKLLEDLRDSRYASGQPMGVNESNVRRLWKSH